jgi:hypothetical protein
MSKEELETDARRCGLADPEPLIALNELKPWAQAQGFENRFYGRMRTRNPRHRYLVVRAKRFTYRIQLEPNPLCLRLDVVEPGQPFVAGFWSMVDREAWGLVRARILAAESGGMMPF